MLLTATRNLVRDISPATPQAGSPQKRKLARLVPVAVGAIFAGLIALHGGEFVHELRLVFRASWTTVAAAAALEAASLAGYVLLLHRVVSRDTGLRPRDSYDITLGGTAATRLLPTAGLGGAAVTVWALRARGIRPAEVTERLLAFLLLLYAVYMAALIASGLAVAFGLVAVDGGGALGLAGAALGLVVATGVLALLAAPGRTAGMLDRAAGRHPRLRPAVAQLPVLRRSLDRAWDEVRRPHPALFGALAWWGFDIAVLVAMLHAFGASVPIPAVVLAYFLGTACNVLPLPGSLSGGLSAVLIALGAPAAPAIAAVLAYRTVAVWLPAASGIASLASLRSSVAAWRAQPDAASPTPTPCAASGTMVPAWP